MQGSPLSPKLFNFLVDYALKQSPLLRKLCQQHLIGMYADDMAVEVSNAEETRKVIEELEQLRKRSLRI